MNFLDVIILGIVEGITEFLPVSSTGHLILVSQLLGIAETDFTKSFNIIIQLGAILAVVILYWKTLISHQHLIKKAVIGFIPTAVLGLIFYKSVKSLLGSGAVVAWSLIIGGALLIIFEIIYRTRTATRELFQPELREDDPQGEVARDITYTQAGLIGLFQSIAFIPGVSRSGATIIGGQLLGISRKSIVEFSFILAVPTMLAASGLDIIKEFNNFNPQNIELLILGFLVSFTVAFIAIKSFISFIQKHSFISFGIYRIIIGILFLLFMMK